MCVLTVKGCTIASYQLVYLVCYLRFELSIYTYPKFGHYSPQSLLSVLLLL
jgi:hypothetical protein